MNFDSDLVSSLEDFGKILSIRLADVQDPLAIAREHAVDALAHHLDNARQKSFLAVGPSGCGKTAILYQLVKRVGTREDRPWLVLETSTSMILAGTVYIGEWQTRLHALIDQAQSDQQVAVYITDIANMVGAGRHSKSDENMAAVVTPFVESGELVLFGECTEDGYRRGIERYPSFKKLFTAFRIEPQSDQQVEEVVSTLAQRRGAELEQELGQPVKLTDSALTAVRQFGGLYFPGTALPGGAVRLLDQLIQAQRRVSLHGPASPALQIDHSDVVQALESFTGIPSRLLDDAEALDLQQTRSFFESRVVGQSAAVEAVVDLITLIKAGVTDPKKPLGILLFVGPTGVGKTELAKALAEFIFGSQDRMIRFDMSEFKDYSSFEKWIGSPSAMEGSTQQSGSLLAKVRQQPFSVILLDEIEKAHSNIFDLLLQMFDDGRLTDAQARTTNFTQTIVVMTSNLGSEAFQATPLGFSGQADGSPDDDVAAAVKNFFRPELLNRIDRVITFQPLARQHVQILARRELGQVLMRSGITRRQLRVDVDPGVIDILARAGFDPARGARPLKRAVERLALLPVARKIVGMTDQTRPALMRLQPSGNRIGIRLVYDRQTRKSESIARGVTITDPAEGKPVRQRLNQIQQQLDALQRVAADIQSECSSRKLAEQKSDLVERTTTVDFWDDPKSAREVLTDLYRAERLLEAADRVQRRTDELAESFESAQKNGDRKRLTKVANRLPAVRRHADLVGYALQCRDAVDRCDAFVSISLIDECVSDLAGHLADMYMGWAYRKGFVTRIVHEELVTPKVTQELIFSIEGVAVYGLLAAEEGIHEFVYGKTSKAAKRTYLVKVRVLPIVEDRHALTADKVTIDSRRSRGTGLRCERYRSRVRVTDKASLLSVTGHSALSPDESTDVLTELLAAERRAIAARRGPDESTTESMVRRYTMRPSQSAKDLRTRVVTHNLRELWKGDLDEFLTAALAARQTT